MATTMARSLAEQFRLQAAMGEKLLRLAGAGTEQDRSGEVLGSPDASLTVRGNIGDVAMMNHYTLLAAMAAGAVPGECDPTLRADCPADYPGFGAFLSPRETFSPEEAVQKLRVANEGLAKAIKGLTDEQLETPVATVFGTIPLRQILFSMVTHGGMHFGQAWGILKGAGHTTHGFEVLFF
jgi:hypothetical protein